MICCNFKGDEKIKPLVIGKSACTSAFKNFVIIKVIILRG